MKSTWSFAALLTVAASSPPVERVVTGNGATTITLKGISLRARIMPGATAMPVFTASAAVSAGLKPGMFAGTFRIGRVRLRADTGVADLAIGDVRWKRRIAWTSEPFAPGFDGVIGPGGVPEPVVRFVLRPARGGERTAALPLDLPRWDVASTTAIIGGVPMEVTFNPHAARTVANAAAGVALATTHDGTVSGKAELVPIIFGIARPVRTLTLVEPVDLGPLSFSRLVVRVADGGAVNLLPEAGADTDEVVVVGKGKQADAELMIGADLLGRCSELIFDKPRRQIMLTCA